MRTHLTLSLTAMLTIMAAPAFAQDAICADGQWIGGDEASSDITALDDYHEQMALILGGNQHVALFAVSEETDIRVEAAGRGIGDPQIDLLDSDGQAILSDDDSGGNSAARAETTLPAGNYCLVTRSYDGGPMTAFVRVGRTEHEALTDGAEAVSAQTEGSCETATPLGEVGSSVTASVDETPFWSFTLDAPTPITITAENDDADPVIKLFDAADDLLAENDDFDGLNSQIEMSEPLQSGTYCLGVTALNDTGVPITVSVTEYDPVASQLALYGTGEAAPPLDGTFEMTDLGVLTGRVRHDVQVGREAVWHKITVEQPGLMVVEAVAGTPNGDPWVAVYDDLGRQVVQNDDTGNGLDSFAPARVERGTYLIAVKQVSDGNGLIRLVFEGYAPIE